MIDQTDPGSKAVVSIDGLTRRFGKVVALDDVRLTVPRGTVFGLVGVNGAGKTTLLKHVLGLLRAKTGLVRVLGLDPAADPVGVLSQIGYLGEENDLPGWMQVHELLAYTRAFYPTWDEAYAQTLRNSFGLDPAARVKNLSKGQRVRTGLLLALAHRPDLLVLDEPSSGLDPIARRDILEAVVRTISEEGRTVLFSSHLLHEVQRVSDHMTMLHEGRVVFSDGFDEIQASYRELTIRFAEPQIQPPPIPNTLGWQGTGHEWSAVCRGAMDEIRAAVSQIGARIVEDHTPSLEEIFIAQVASESPAGAED
ncbi:MAG: ABC transporter ATP-binding protein [Thermoguttaceae bacterium]